MMLKKRPYKDILQTQPAVKVVPCPIKVSAELSKLKKADKIKTYIIIALIIVIIAMLIYIISRLLLKGRKT